MVIAGRTVHHLLKKRKWFICISTNICLLYTCHITTETRNEHFLNFVTGNTAHLLPSAGRKKKKRKTLPFILSIFSLHCNGTL